MLREILFNLFPLENLEITGLLKIFGQVSIGKNMYYFPSIVGKTSQERMFEQAKYCHSNWHNITKAKYLKTILGNKKQN